MDDYKEGFLINVSINDTAINKDVDNWGHYNANFKPRKLTPRGLALEVWNGFAFAPVYHGKSRKKSEFKEAYHVALDFDVDADLDKICAHPLAQQFGSFGYSTPSSTPDNPKSRLVFVMMTPIGDYQRYETLVKALIKEFGGADEACKDATRLFFGSKGCKVKGIWSYLPAKAADAMIARYQEKIAAERPPQPQNVIVLPQTGGSSKYVAAAVEGELAFLRQAGKGERHQQLLKSAFAVGQLVGADWAKLGYNDALAAICGACGGWDSQAEVERVASSALTAGMAEPRQQPQRTIKVYEV